MTPRRTNRAGPGSCRRAGKFRLLLLLCLAACMSPAPASASAAEASEPARVKISGFGLFGNREMLRLLGHFQPEGKPPPVIGRTFVEDAALVLFSRSRSEGYLSAALEAEFVLADGSRETIVWTDALDAQMRRDLAADEAHFRMKKGVRFHYDSLEIEGLKAIPERRARSYFFSGDTMFRLRANRVFNPELLKGSMAALKEALAREGYRDAVVNTGKVERDEASGAVAVTLRVEEGLLTVVRSVAVTVEGPDDKADADRRTLHPDTPHTQLWQQDFARQLREEQYARGYPDATVEFSLVQRERNATRIQVDLSVRVHTGPRVRVGTIVYSGNEKTRSSVLERRVTIGEGDWLNRLEAERSRQRLARLGVFDSVSLRYEAVDPGKRNVIYGMKEGKPMSLSLLAGYGSYELLRGGMEFEHRNVFGRAHSLHLRAVQSFKSSSGDLQYTVPEVLGENVNVFAKASGLRREEASFTRREYGASAGLQKRLEKIETDMSVHYDYEFLNAAGLDLSVAESTGVQKARAAALVLDLNRDRRKTPLLPRRGLKLFGKLELASAVLGGNVDYQRAILGGSYHLDLHGGRLLHVGLIHGMSFTLGASPEDLPFNKRFFPGGQNSVRGFQEGEASPLDAEGRQLGAETYTLGNLEFEQLLTKSWSVAVFLDGVGMARNRNDSPWNEQLYSVGAGIRWRTVIGPVRLEYGHNLNPRPMDPAGTLHFSIGFPF